MVARISMSCIFIPNDELSEYPEFEKSVMLEGQSPNELWAFEYLLLKIGRAREGQSSEGDALPVQP